MCYDSSSSGCSACHYINSASPWPTCTFARPSHDASHTPLLPPPSPPPPAVPKPMCLCGTLIAQLACKPAVLHLKIHTDMSCCLSFQQEICCWKSFRPPYWAACIVQGNISTINACGLLVGDELWKLSDPFGICFQQDASVSGPGAVKDTVKSSKADE